MPKRKISLVFPDVAADAEICEQFSWRAGGMFSDWSLRLGIDQVYPVHRVVLGTGPRASVFLNKAFASETFGYATSRETDLSELLPEVCKGTIFDMVLDFSYQGKLPCDLPAEDLVLLLRVGDVLQMRALMEASIVALNADDMITKDSAPHILLALGRVRCEGSSTQTEIETLAAMTVAQHFYEYSEEERASWSIAMLELVLMEPCLQVPSEDYIYDVVRNLVSRTESLEQKIGLWQKVRFGCLSPGILVEAAGVEEIPKEIFVFLAAARQLLPPLWIFPLARDYEDSLMSLKVVGLDASWVGIQHFVPRVSASLKCAYAFAWQCDGNGIKAAALNFKGHSLCHALRALGCEVELINIAERTTFKQMPGLLNKFDVVIMSPDAFAKGKSVLNLHARAASIAIAQFVAHGGGLLALSTMASSPFECRGLAFPLKRNPHVENLVSDSRSLRLLKEHAICRHIDAASFRTTAPVQVEAVAGAQIIAQWSTGEPAIAEGEGGRILVDLTHNRQGSISSQYFAVAGGSLRLWVNAVLYLGKRHQDLVS